MYITKNTNFITESDFKKLNIISKRITECTFKAKKADGRQKKYYELRLARLNRDKKKLICKNKSVYFEFESDKILTGANS